MVQQVTELMKDRFHLALGQQRRGITQRWREISADHAQMQGARIGMPMVVVRGERIIAELKVVEVRERICGALIERVQEGVTLKTGDVARVARNS